MDVGRVTSASGLPNPIHSNSNPDGGFSEMLLQLTNGGSSEIDHIAENPEGLDLEMDWEDGEELEYSHEETSNMLLWFHSNLQNKDKQIAIELDEGALPDIKIESIGDINLVSKGDMNYESIGYEKEIPFLEKSSLEKPIESFEPVMDAIPFEEKPLEATNTKEIPSLEKPIEGFEPVRDTIPFEKKPLEASNTMDDESMGFQKENPQIPADAMLKKVEVLDIGKPAIEGKFHLEKEISSLEESPPEKSIEGFEPVKKEKLEEKNLDFKEQDIQLENFGTNPRIDSFHRVIDPSKGELSQENVERLSDTIIESIKTTTVGDTNFMEVKLYPKELGNVHISLKFEQGKLTARILVDNDNLKGLFLNSLNELNAKLEGHKINIQKIDIDFNISMKAGFDFNSNPGGKQYPGEGFNQNPRGSFREKGFSNMIGVKLENIALGEDSLRNKGISILV